MRIRLSILDLAPIGKGETATESFAHSVALAQRAESLGYERVWYAEHHNMPTIASSATSVVIAHVGAHTSRIRLGAGGVMLPNHAPLTIAEQFGTLAAMYPGRIDLGLGRAPGSDQHTMYALRRDPRSSDSFPGDVVELQGYLKGESHIPGVDATPGKGSNVPLYILGSSLFGAQLAATLGLPYAFASHFAPAALEEAVALYRRDFQPSDQLQEPYVIAGANVIAAETQDVAEREFQAVRRSRALRFFGRARGIRDAEGGDTDDDELADQLLAGGAAAHVDQLLTYTATGIPTEVGRFLEGFAEHAQADEVIVAFPSVAAESRLRSATLLAEAMQPLPAQPAKRSASTAITGAT